jgi:hypothetical protein
MATNALAAPRANAYDDILIKPIRLRLATFDPQTDHDHSLTAPRGFSLGGGMKRTSATACAADNAAGAIG